MRFNIRRALGFEESAVYSKVYLLQIQPLEPHGFGYDPVVCQSRNCFLEQFCFTDPLFCVDCHIAEVLGLCALHYLDPAEYP